MRRCFRQGSPGFSHSEGGEQLGWVDSLQSGTHIATIADSRIRDLIIEELHMSRLVTLFTGQWADLPIEDMCRKTREFGYNGMNWHAGVTTSKWIRPWRR